MKYSTCVKSSLIAAALAFVNPAQATPGLGGLYEWWGGSANFGSQSRSAQGRSSYSCTQDLYRQRDIGVNDQNLTFTSFTPCSKSPYPKNYLLPIAVKTADGTDQSILELEQDFAIDDYRQELKNSVNRYEDKKRELAREFMEDNDVDELSDSELEYVDLMSYFTLESDVNYLNEVYRIDDFKKKVKGLLDAEQIEIVGDIER